MTNWLIFVTITGILLKPVTVTTKSGNPVVSVLITWLLVQVGKSGIADYLLCTFYILLYIDFYAGPMTASTMKRALRGDANIARWL